MIEHQHDLVEALEELSLLAERADSRAGTTVEGDHSPLVVQHLRDGHTVNLALGDDQHLAVVGRVAQVLAEEACGTCVTQHLEPFVSSPDLLRNDLAVTLVVSDLYDVTRHTGDMVAELAACLLGQLTLAKCLVFST